MRKTRFPFTLRGEKQQIIHRVAAPLIRHLLARFRAGELSIRAETSPGTWLILCTHPSGHHFRPSTPPKTRHYLHQPAPMIIPVLLARIFPFSLQHDTIYVFR